MLSFLIVLAFIVLIAIGVPIAFAIGMISILGIATIDYIPNLTVPMKMLYGLNSFTLLAVPLFILSANLMNKGNISKKLIDFSISLVGHISGGLAYSNILVSMIFAGVSGSSTADTAGIGKILIPRMIEDGYDKETSIGVTAASSTIGSIIPPSITMVIFGGLTNASIGALFLGGIIPGILVGIVMMVVVFFQSKKRNYPSYKKTSIKSIAKLFIESLPALITPVIIIGGITTGWYTATEAAAFAAIYSFIVGKYVYKILKFSDLPEILVDTLKLSSLSLFALSTASALGELLGYYNINKIIQGFFSANFKSQSLFLVVVIIFFLIIGTFMDAIPAMILFIPVILPSALALGVSNILLGIIVVITLAIGLITPPYGLCLLIASSIGDLPVEKSIKAVGPYLAVILLVLALIVFVPNTVMFLANLV